MKLVEMPSEYCQEAENIDTVLARLLIVFLYWEPVTESSFIPFSSVLVILTNHIYLPEQRLTSRALPDMQSLCNEVF